MTQPSFFRDLITEIEEGGVSRAEIASALGVKPNMISSIKTGKVLPGDDRLAALAKLSGRYNERDLYRAKWAQWLKTEKGLDPRELITLG